MSCFFFQGPGVFPWVSGAGPVASCPYFFLLLVFTFGDFSFSSQFMEPFLSALQCLLSDFQSVSWGWLSLILASWAVGGVGLGSLDYTPAVSCPGVTVLAAKAVGPLEPGGKAADGPATTAHEEGILQLPSSI